MLTGSSTWPVRHLCSCCFSISADKLCNPKLCQAFYYKIFSRDKLYIHSKLSGLLLHFKAYSLKTALCPCGTCHMVEACTEAFSDFLTSAENVLPTLSCDLFMLLNSSLIQELCGCGYSRYTSYWGKLECWHKLYVFVKNRKCVHLLWFIYIIAYDVTTWLHVSRFMNFLC